MKHTVDVKTHEFASWWLAADGYTSKEAIDTLAQDIQELCEDRIYELQIAMEKAEHERRENAKAFAEEMQFEEMRDRQLEQRRKQAKGEEP